jgi:basic amino acid/polyamine antiporter, APA family
MWSAMAVVIGSMIGSGIFRSPSAIAGQVPAAGPMLLVWLVGGLFALCGALSISELATAYPSTGGLYAFLREGWGRPAAFLFGWSQLTILRAAGLGGIAITFGEYFVRLCGKDPGAEPYSRYAHYTAAAAIALNAAFNFLGARRGAAVNTLTVLGKYGALCFIIVIALVSALRGPAAQATHAAYSASFSPGAFGLALVAVLWAYDGWSDVCYVAGEVTEPPRNLPRAIVGGTVAVAAIYLLANVGYLAVLPVEQIHASPLVAAEVAQRLLGRPGAVFVSAAVALSTFGTLSANLLTNPRIFFAMADDGLFFKSVAKVHPKHQTPYVAVLLIAALGITSVLFLNFEQLSGAFVAAILPFYALGVGAIYRVRRQPGYSPAFRAPGYPWVPALFILSVLFLLASELVNPVTAKWAVAIFALMAAGVPVYRCTVGRPSFAARTPAPGGE